MEGGAANVTVIHGHVPHWHDSLEPLIKSRDYALQDFVNAHRVQGGKERGPFTEK